MIGYLNGELIESRPGKIMIDVNGVGFVVNISESAREELPSIGNPVKVYTYMSVREDDISLFGFLTRDALDMFMLLIGVSGVGPKGAQSILSVFTTYDLKYAIITEDTGKISKAPTIGKKTAERIVLELKDKFGKDEMLEAAGFTKELTTSKLSGNAEEALLALEALGYDHKTALNAISMISNSDELDTNAILKAALKNM